MLRPVARSFIKTFKAMIHDHEAVNVCWSCLASLLSQCMVKINIQVCIVILWITFLTFYQFQPLFWQSMCSLRNPSFISETALMKNNDYSVFSWRVCMYLLRSVGVDTYSSVSPFNLKSLKACFFSFTPQFLNDVRKITECKGSSRVG